MVTKGNSLRHQKTWLMEGQNVCWTSLNDTPNVPGALVASTSKQWNEITEVVLFSLALYMMLNQILEKEVTLQQRNTFLTKSFPGLD